MPRLRTLMLVALGLISTVAVDSLVSVADAKDEIVKRGGFICRVRDLGCSATQCCSKARCSGRGVTSGWVPACVDVELPLEPLR
jgi:hypothetical protein